jgi:diguanylate cyclase (GGDEF)-like protein
VLFDLDSFKEVNDLRGHMLGDKLLQCVAARLQEFQTGSTLLARIGGDEFAVLVQQIASRP